MLKYAFFYKDRLEKLYYEKIDDVKLYFYHMRSYVSFDNFTIDPDTKRSIQCVSVDNRDNIHGYLSAFVDRMNNHVYQIAAINFSGNRHLFGMDLLRFIEKIAGMGFVKVKFTAVVGSEGQIMYDRFVPRISGKIVGTFKNDVRMTDGRYADVRHYEILIEDFFKWKQRKNT